MQICQDLIPFLLKSMGIVKLTSNEDGSKHKMPRLKMRRLCCLILIVLDLLRSAKQHCLKVPGFNYLFNDVSAALQGTLVLMSSECSPGITWTTSGWEWGSQSFVWPLGIFDQLLEEQNMGMDQWSPWESPYAS